MLIDILKFSRKKLLGIIVSFIVLFLAFLSVQYIVDRQEPKELEDNIGIDVYRLLRCDVNSVVKDETGEVLLYNFADLWKRPTLMSEFADRMSLEYDMSILYEDWDKYIIEEQVNRLKSNIEVNKIGNLLYEIRCYNEVPVSDKDVIVDLVNNMIDDYIDYIRTYTKFSDPNANFEVVKEHTYVRTELKSQFSKVENLVLKEFVLSFAGAFLVTLFFFLLLYTFNLMKDKKRS